MSVDKKSSQLGMNASTAASRLVKDLLFDFVQKSGMDTCFRCGKKVTRETFSIEHKTSWLDSDDPKGLFFDLENIAYSHKLCNSIAGATRYGGGCGTRSEYSKGCRCDKCVAAATEMNRKYYTPEKRRAQYLRTGT